MAALNESAFVAIGFALFVILIWRRAGAALSAMLDERTNRIKAELEEAQSLREEAAAELQKFQRLSREAADEAKTILANAEVTAQRITQAAEEKAAASLKRREEQAKAKIEAAEAALVSELRSKSASLAIAAAQQVMTDKLDTDASMALVEESLKQIEASTN
ncbi:MAG: ATP synthase F0 subunit B [Candidatus Puniceispirillaceae bacterium]